MRGSKYFLLFGDLSKRGLHRQALFQFSKHNQLQDFAAKSLKSKSTLSDDPSKFQTKYMSSPDAIAKRRQMQAKYLDIQEEKKKNLEIFVEAYSDTIIEFQLYMMHDCPKCQTLDAIMNFYQIAYKRNQNIVYLDNFKKSFKEQLKEITWPVLKVNISLEPVKFIQGEKNIENFFVENNFIPIPRHRTNSVWAIQGVEFAQNSINPVLNSLFLHPILTFENSLKSAPETYRHNIRSYVLIKALRLNLTKAIVMIGSNFIKLTKNWKEYRSSRQKLLEMMKEWETRLQGQSFHGGENPDEADFSMYGVLKAKYNSKSFQRFIEKEFPERAYKWFIRMQINCKYEERTLFNE